MRKEKFTIKKPFDEMCKTVVSILEDYYKSKQSLDSIKRKNEVVYYPLKNALLHDEIKGFYIRVVKVNNSVTHIDVVDEGSDKFNISFVQNMAQGFINELFTVYTETFCSIQGTQEVKK